MTELKEIITGLFFGSTFTLGFTMGILASIGFYYSAKRKKEIDREEDEAIAEREGKIIENKKFSKDNINDFIWVVEQMEKHNGNMSFKNCTFDVTDIPKELEERFWKCVDQMDDEFSRLLK